MMNTRIQSVLALVIGAFLLVAGCQSTEERAAAQSMSIVEKALYQKHLGNQHLRTAYATLDEKRARTKFDQGLEAFQKAQDFLFRALAEAPRGERDHIEAQIREIDHFIEVVLQDRPVEPVVYSKHRDSGS